MFRFAVLSLLATVTVLPALAQTTAYDKGPGGLEAWTDDRHTKEFRTNTEPFGIVIARAGKVIRRIGDHDGGPFFWNLMLLPDGKRIAYESGPFHFAMTCTLMDIATGKHLQDYDCFSSDNIDNGPQWVKDLLSVERTPPAGTILPSLTRKREDRSLR